MAHAQVGDWGPELNHLLNRFANFVREQNLSVADAERLINAGIASLSAARPEAFAAPVEAA